MRAPGKQAQLAGAVAARHEITARVAELQGVYDAALAVSLGGEFEAQKEQNAETHLAFGLRRLTAVDRRVAAAQAELKAAEVSDAVNAPKLAAALPRCDAGAALDKIADAIRVIAEIDTHAKVDVSGPSDGRAKRLLAEAERAVARADAVDLIREHLAPQNTAHAEALAAASALGVALPEGVRAITMEHIESIVRLECYLLAKPREVEHDKWIELLGAFCSLSSRLVGVVAQSVARARSELGTVDAFAAWARLTSRIGDIDRAYAEVLESRRTPVEREAIARAKQGGFEHAYTGSN